MNSQKFKIKLNLGKKKDENRNRNYLLRNNLLYIIMDGKMILTLI